MLAVGDKYGSYYRSIEAAEGERLTTAQCLDFLIDVSNETDQYLFAFSFGYDVTQILYDLHRANASELSKEHKTTYRVGKYAYRIEYIGRNKPFKVVKYLRRGKAQPLGSVTVFDVWGFVQSSFVKWVESWNLATEPDQIEFLTEMKQGRSEFTEAERDTIREYNRLELALIAKGAERVRELFDSADIPLATFNGAGSAAEALLRKYRVHEFQREQTPEFEAAAMAGYFGGRIEAATVGGLGNGYVYDINSAYPAAMPDLPCMKCGEWAVNYPSDIRLSYIEWEAPIGIKWGPFPVRLWASPDNVGDYDKSYTVIYPSKGKGWIWHYELETIKRLHPEYKIDVKEWYGYVAKCSHQPLDFVRDLYTERSRLKAANDPRNIPLKLGLNSLYGKFAQRVGTPKYQCIAWAGIITSYCRSLLYDAIHRSNGAVEFVQTDSVFSTEPLDLPQSKTLGEWEGEAVQDMIVLQAGVYRYKKGDKVVEKYRGFDKGIDFDLILQRATEGRGMYHTETLSATRLIPFGLAATSDNLWPLRGQFVTMERELNLRPKAKRVIYPPTNISLPNHTVTVPDWKIARSIWFMAGGNEAAEIKEANGILG